MPKQRGETPVIMRAATQQYIASYTSGNNVEFEGFSDPGTSEGDAKWLIVKHTYNSDNFLTNSKYAGGADFVNIWTNRASLTYQ